MAIEDAITNDPAIERHGSEAAAKYMAWHWAALSKAVAKGDPTSCVLTESRQSDDRLYGCFRASISEPVERLDLKTPTWRDLLTCMAGRVVDFSFMTLLRPDPFQSYEAQRSELLVVPRAQFVMVELARQREGCYDDRDCCVRAEARHLSRCAERLRRGDNDALAALEAAPLPSKAVPTRRRRSDASMAWADNTRAQVLRLTSASRALAAHARSGSEAAARIVDAWRQHLEPPETEFATRGVVVRRGALETEVLAALTAASSESLAAFEKEVLACVEINQCVGCTAGSVGRRGTGTLTLSSRRRVDGVEDDATVLAPQNKTIRDSFDDASGTTRPGSRVDVRHRAAEFVAQRLGTCEAELADDDRGVGTRLLRDLLPLVRAALRTDRPRLLYLGFVRAFAGGTVDQPWHRDAASLFESSRGACDAPDTPPHVLNVFLPLVDLTNANGPTAFAPGTHNDAACRDALATIIERGDPARQISPLLSRGDAVMFDCRLLHRGRANRSSKDRVIAYLTVAAPWWRDDEMFHAAPPTTAAALLGEALLGRTAVDDHDDGTGHPHYTLKIESLVEDRPDLAAPAALFLARASDEVEGKWAAAAASSTSLSRMLTASLDDPRPADAFADRFEADLRDAKGRRADALRAPTAPNGELFSSITDDLADCSRLYVAAGALLNAEAYGFPSDDEGVPLLLALAKRAAPPKSRRRLEAAFTSWWHRGRGRFELVERVAGAGDRPVLVVAFSSLGSGIARPEWRGALSKASLPSKARLDVLHVLDPASSWYLQDDAATWAGPAFYRRELEQRIKPYGSRVLFLGDSMGACGALQHCDLAATLAFTPQVDLTNYEAVRRHDLTAERRASLRDAICDTVGRAKGPVLVHYGSECAEDVAQVEMLPGSATLVAHDFDDHVLSVHLKKTGRLQGILDAAIASVL